MAKWKTLHCWDCGGHGLVSAYTADGSDFLGAAECGTCGGSGRIYRSPKGALAQWPGGPFVGRESAPTR
jgi:DnaJ-class molecular chaperone